jgi:hypothetical protein
MADEPQKSYLRRLLRFYLDPHWVSLLKMLYLGVFAYFAIYHFNNIVLALKFMGHTLRFANSLLELSFLYWGAAFIVSLVLPFSVSVHALLVPYEISRKEWPPERKVLVILVLAALSLAAIAVLNEVIKIIAAQDVLRSFIIRNELLIGPRVKL